MKIAYKALGHAAAFALALACSSSIAQNYPTRPIHFVVPYAPGGTDLIARAIGQALAERLGQPVILDNKPGGDSVVGTDFVAKSAPDGYTLLVGSAGLVVNTGLVERLPYDPVKDFAPITVFGRSPVVLSVNASFPARTLKELVAMAKAKPGGLFYGTGAPVFTMAMEVFKKDAGLDIVQVPYKGSAPAMVAAISGEVPMSLASIAISMPYFKGGKLRPLMVAAPQRSAFLPDVPTGAESGVKFDGAVFAGLLAPAGTPRPIIDKLYAEVAAVLKQDAIKERVVTMGYETGDMGMPPEEFAAYIRSAVEQFTRIGKELRLTKR
ncbi:MAG: tripartite tricarboxylate transporter substrate binding protein [Betaproteobacteria bacterium]|nr:tripartite tricarboxylate transporter substrate binding protein [Betaproteobacteria bacterium]